MKRTMKFSAIAVLLSAIMIVSNLNAQVRIGGTAKSHDAAVLDLNTDDSATPVTKGALALPRVNLTSETMQLNGATPADGMLVYNTNVTLGAGIYVWTTNKWRLVDAVPVITVQPRAFSWKETTGATDYTGVTSPTDPTPLTSSTISITAIGATSYQWYELSRTGQATLATGSGNNTATYTPAGTALGMRQYYCVVSNAYGSIKSEIAKVAVGCGAMTVDGNWRTFMCYNLGATETTIAGQLAYDHNLYFNGALGHTPATSALEIDSAVYGNLYQWGRIPDGHEKRNSPNSTTTNTPSAGPYTGRDVAWPAGYEIKPDGATTTLFLPAAGHRNAYAGQLYYPGVYGYYWSATPYGDLSYYLYFTSVMSI